MHITWWILAVAFFGCAGAWWALAHVRRLPTVRMLLALLAGIAGAIIISSWITAASAWYGHLVGGLPSPWPVILDTFPVAVFAAAVVLMLIGAHPREAPDHAAEILAVCACAVLLFVSGSAGPVMAGISHVVSGGAR
jgi:hypothetical protein